MASPELRPEENAHLRELVREAIRRFGSQNQLAMKLEVQGSSIGAFLKGGGMSEENARRFATIMGLTLDEVLGRTTPKRSVETRTPQMGMPVRGDPTRTPPASGPPAYRPTAKALAIARSYLRQPPQNFDPEVIDHAAAEIWLDSPELADRPSAVAEALRIAILGSAIHFPLHPQQPPSSSPPAGTRRSKIRGR